jgi:hypothetical protein
MKGDVSYNKKKRLRPETLLERLERYRTGVDQRQPIITARISAKPDMISPDKIEELICFVARENHVSTENVHVVINALQYERDQCLRQQLKCDIKIKSKSHKFNFDF